jgi:hypothetical protein
MVYNVLLYVMLILLITEYHAALAFCSHRKAWQHFVDFVIELFWVGLFRSLIVLFILNNLTYRGADISEWPPLTPHRTFKFVLIGVHA